MDGQDNLLAMPEEWPMHVCNDRIEKRAEELSDPVREANDVDRLRELSVSHSGIEATTARLLQQLYCLRRNNAPAAREYIRLVAAAVSHATVVGYDVHGSNGHFETCLGLVRTCIQHPAYDSTARANFRLLLQKLLHLQQQAELKAQLQQQSSQNAGSTHAISPSPTSPPPDRPSSTTSTSSLAALDTGRAPGLPAGSRLAAWTSDDTIAHPHGSPDPALDQDLAHNSADKRRKARPTLTPRRLAPDRPPGLPDTKASHPSTDDQQALPLSNSLAHGEVLVSDMATSSADHLLGDATRAAFENAVSSGDTPADRTPPSEGNQSHIRAWLKKLRLHKYQSIFASLSQEAIFALTDEELENRGWTFPAVEKAAHANDKNRTSYAEQSSCTVACR
ncbi:uncharacterized protein MONBRDRAFT_6054 [Monosiga brevicollis MX1]|uniref:SMAUG/ZCCHC2-like PHAT domain-containing protein n=1 Tax=Monosiga brevicollis TaxID=81824 RepID=A9URF5_MONBE|nr:uncharacterized protein MONBRDRAFT_6054 [Monosiga brevicollis MX1]EDQ91913.1 predicted protein [Monosiga brevicollis MX1]|eukprot:XP_001743199.1 hypothetical protein [Monosiga brevicollis MX1]